MRSRLLASTLGITLLAVLVLGLPLTVVARRQVYASARDTLRDEAASVGAALEDRVDNGNPIDLTRYAERLPGRRLILVTSLGRRTTSGPQLAGPVLQTAVQVSDATLTVQADLSRTADRARDVTLEIGGLALLALGAAVALAMTQARRLTEPLARLANRADALGHGHFAPEPTRSGIAEIDQISDELDRSASQIAATIAVQRDFASEAAHQLRTPLTGIVLRLDELIGCDDPIVRAEAEAALIQVERLKSVIDVLLARARGDADDPEPIDIDAFLSEEFATWGPTFAASGRRLEIASQGEHHVRARRAHLVSIMTCLLENALLHGSGDVMLGTAQARGGVQIAVTDSGSGVAPDIVDLIFTRRFSAAEGHGIGLALARSLAESEGGTLTYGAGTKSVFVLWLPGDSHSPA